MAETLRSQVNDLKAEFANFSLRLKAIEDAKVTADLVGVVEKLSGKIDALDNKITDGVAEGTLKDLMAKVDELAVQMKDPRETTEN